MSRIIEGMAAAWISPYSGLGPHNIHELDQPGDLTFTSLGVDMGSSGYTRVGTAEIKVTIASTEVLVSNKISSLEAEILAIEGEAEAKVTKVRGQIQQLLAITYQPAEEGAA